MRVCKWWRVLIVLIVLVCAGVASAQTGAPAAATAPAAAAEGVAATGMDWRQILESGGWIMYVLSGLSVLTLAFVIYFFAVLRVGQVAPPALHRELVEKIMAGSLDDARKACEFKPSPLAAVAMSAMDHLRDMPDSDPVLLKDVVEGEGARQAEAIQGQTQYLLDTATVAPMVGLLGTVFGMLRAFSSIALDIAKAKPIVLANGVSQALITTAFGLMVGIPAMMFYAYFRRKASKLVSYLETASTDVLTALRGKRAR